MTKQDVNHLDFAEFCETLEYDEAKQTLQLRKDRVRQPQLHGFERLAVPVLEPPTPRPETQRADGS